MLSLSYYNIMSKTYEVTYSGDRTTKKRKRFQDGFLQIENSDFSKPFRIRLLSDNKDKVLFSCVTSAVLKESLLSGSFVPIDIRVGPYEVSVLSEADPASAIEISTQITSAELSSTADNITLSKKLKWSKKDLSFAPFTMHTAGPAEVSRRIKSGLSLETLLEIDRQLKQHMQPHQVTAAKFLIKKLYVSEIIPPDNIYDDKDYNNEISGNNMFYRAKRTTNEASSLVKKKSEQEGSNCGKISSNGTAKIIPGAILGDSMGLGTLFLFLLVERTAKRPEQAIH